MGPLLEETLSKMILSPSGWRGIFAQDGDAESRNPQISSEHSLIVTAAARAFSDYLAHPEPGQKKPRRGAIIVGRDTRPTGEAIAQDIILSLSALGNQVLYAGVCASPEIMAFTRKRAAEEGAGYDTIQGFIYISASHNPIGYNGLKFGLTGGGTIPAQVNSPLVLAFKEALARPKIEEELEALLERANPEIVDLIYEADFLYKDMALEDYTEFSRQVISGFSGGEKQESFFEGIRQGLEQYPLGIGADFNGSARAQSIDRSFLSSLGVSFSAINAHEILSPIVPEGASLDKCREFLEELHRQDSRNLLAYMPDCDGDRGNLVVIADQGKARNLEAQEVFALACVAELSSLVWTGELSYDPQGRPLQRAALVVNDPTSNRIDRIAGAFGVQVHRAEVGEANVVGLAAKLRDQGYLVRILGEGSAGGTIIHPAAVRDPINTLGGILKILLLRGDEGPFAIWCRLSGQEQLISKDFGLAQIIASLPVYHTTGAYTDDALLSVQTKDHAKLKECYQGIFTRDWEKERKTLQKMGGIDSWEAASYRGLEESRGITNFGEAGTGGLKIELLRGSESRAWIWMRGSATEPVFRIMADAPDPELERYLITWQRRMVLEADRALASS
ncbi:MAG: phosphatidylglycerol lysyltransferase [Treponema sp.]|nr:phosphatidylglycerol lysyltransferase [Treponema sp.]